MRDEVKMDANKLITEVYKRPALWNQRHVSYHNRELTNCIWMEIAALFKIPKPVLKAKWKGLRDTFRAELKKEQVYRKSKYKRHRPLWIHFESLQFLKEQMLPRPPIWERNSLSSNQNRDNCDYYEDRNNDSSKNNDDSLAEHLLKSSVNRLESDQHDLQNEFKKEPSDQMDEMEYNNDSPLNRFNEHETILQNLSPEQVLLAHGNGRNGCDNESSIDMMVDPLDGHSHDDNYYFLMSLLPHMKQLSPEKRMFLRLKMQELVYEEVYKKNQSSSEGATAAP